LAVHTLALVGRIYISGRPPVTNLYSAAVFIGWAGVVLALVFESLYGLGLGNIVASVIGFLTLVIAHFLSLDGDTFTVLLAVLDTQFWLATHVVCIALGNSTTFVAGFFGIVYILLGQVFSVLNNEQRRELSRMTYGTLCFAIFFSFVGTVLGGLWADNSWGRFWGWDPKENGALMIVLFNALVLHARWGGMVSGRGLALLAVGGNIVTAWSLFGTNAMGVGLHSYGFDRGVTTWLLAFVVSQAMLIVIGALPQNWWRFGSAARSV
jgi:ABC-type transport system involved in cytochrome c biogenesis permease subunit